VGEWPVSEQAVDLRSTLSILRRKRRVLVGAAVLGVAAGLCLLLLRPPMYSSSTVVLLPPAREESGETTTREVQTDVEIASSSAVLEEAGAVVTPRVSTYDLAERVDVSATTTDVIRIQASADDAAEAENLAQAIAASYVAFLKEANSSLSSARLSALTERRRALQASLDTVNREIDQTNARLQNEEPNSARGRADSTALARLTAEQADLVLQIDEVKKDQQAARQPGADAGATILEDASPAQRPQLVWLIGVTALAGLAVTVAIAAILIVVFGRRDRKLRYRDEIADAVGSPVIASLRSRAPRTAAGWTSLLETYSPGTLESWTLRQALRQLRGIGEAVQHGTESGDATVHHPSSITVITLSDDTRGLAVAPQLASYAASIDVRTRFVAAQPHESAAVLWASCFGLGNDVEVRPGLKVDTGLSPDSDADLTVILAVADRQSPEILDLPKTTATVLAVSSGSATAEDLVRIAVSADDADHHISGLIVADPDTSDRSTGRLLYHERLQQAPLPSRLIGVSDPDGSTNVSDLRRRTR
jgi:capsular polysaccharide biosynthesis protein